MGLDAYAGFQQPQPKNVEPIDIYTTLEQQFYWRKHARLQEFMQQIWRFRKFGEESQFMQGLHMDGKHDYAEVMFLDKQDILRLQELIENENLPFCPDGFFWGQQFQEESCKEYKDQDLKFCQDALKWLDEGKKVFYDCSW